jgi:TrmH family RNA methyltransferase
MLSKADLQRLRSLRQKKHREALGLFIVEGEKVVSELLAANFPLEEIYATESWPAANAGLRPAPLSAPAFIPVTPTEMSRISHLPAPSPVLAIGRLHREPLAPGALDHGLTLALDGVQDPGNVGTLLRIADWFALDRVVLSADCADLFHQKVIDSSKGSFVRVRTHVADLPAALATARVPILGCDLAGEDLHTLTPLRDAVIVIGSEGRGLSAPLQKIVTRRVTIPRHGAAESLNAAIAAAIVCDNLRRLSAPARP